MDHIQAARNAGVEDDRQTAHGSPLRPTDQRTVNTRDEGSALWAKDLHTAKEAWHGMVSPSNPADGSERERGGGPDPFGGRGGGMYGRFAASLGASLVAMYALAFSQIDVFGHFRLSLSVLWISLSMVSAMGIIMLTAMRSMLPDRRLNLALYAGFVLVLVGAFTAGRVEAFVGDDAFLRSMIPHHSRAIHMCQEANLADPEIVDLCGQIIDAQREEIAQMERIIQRRG